MQRRDDQQVPTGYELDPDTGRRRWVGVVRAGAPCPPWCTLGPGHRFDLHDVALPDEPLHRWHRRDLVHASTVVEVAVTQGETTAPDGVSDVRLDQPTVWAAVEPDEVDPATARRVGRALLEAADLVDALAVEAGR